MLEKIRNIDARGWLLIIIVILFLTDLVIILNVSILREIMPFLFFTIVPGALFIQILRLYKINLVKKLFFAIGISIMLLLMVGFILNCLYPILLKPLALGPVLISLNVLIILLSLIGYYRNKDNFNMVTLDKFKNISKEGLLSPLIFPALFPFMAIFGTYLMNNNGNNILLIAMLLLIPAYVVVLIYLRNKVNSINYPFSIWTISLSLLLMYGLTSSYIIGRDIHGEFYCFQLTLNNLHWDLQSYYNPYNACLSITILPVIYKVLTNINSLYIFKLFFAFIGSFLPLLIYEVSRKYLDNKYAFLATLLFVFQTYFILIMGTIRQEVAFFFFFLAIWIYFEKDVSETVKKSLFVIFVVSAMVSHYTTAYISMALIFPILLLPFFKGLLGGLKELIKNESNISKFSRFKSQLNFQNFDIIFIILILIGLWYVFAANVQFYAGSAVVEGTVSSLTIDQGSVSSRDDAVLGILGIGLQSLPNFISVAVNDLIFLVIGLGLLFILRNYSNYRKKFESAYIFGVILSIGILALFIILPFISNAYGAPRLFLQLLIFLAPIFIIGVIRITKMIRIPKASLAIILVLLISLFTCGTYLHYHFYGIPYSPYYENDGNLRGEYFIYPQEVVAGSWMKDKSSYNRGIEGDIIAKSRIMLGYDGGSLNMVNTTAKSYIYLGYVNVNKKILYMDVDNPVKFDNFTFLNGKNKIYMNGGAEIWL